MHTLASLPLALTFALGTPATTDAADSSSASAEASASEASAALEGPEAPAGRPDVIAPLPDLDYAMRVNRYARGVGIGFNQGIWGEGFGQSLSVDLPFGRRIGQFFGARLAGTFVHVRGDKGYDPVGFGHIDLFGRSPVMAGLVRAYGGGGIRLGGHVTPANRAESFAFTGGGYFGLELFAAPRVSFNVEVGVQGPIHVAALDAGGSATAGVKIWLGDLGSKRR